MKDLLKQLTERIDQANVTKWTDEDFGQLENYPLDGRPEVAFPCALIYIDQNFESLGGNGYDVTSTIIVRVAFDRMGDRTSAKTPDAARKKSLDKLDVVDYVKNMLVGFEMDDVCGPLYLKNILSERRSDGIAVKAIHLTETHEEYQ